MILRLLLLLCVALACVGLPHRAEAATTCTVSAPNIVVAGYDGSAMASANTTVTITCDTDATLTWGGTAYINMCLRIGNTPRQLANGSHLLNYALTRPGGVNWDPPPAQHTVTMSYPIAFLIGGGSGTYSFPITASIPAQSVTFAGTYSQTLTSATAHYRYDEPGAFGSSTMPASCTAGGDGGASTPFPFTVSTTVAGSCQINTATDLDFGTVSGFITAPVNQTSLVTLTCVGGTPWRAGLNDGLNPSGTTRRMTDGAGNFVNYELYRDSARTQRFGIAGGTGAVTGSGTGSSQGVTVYGRVPAPQNATPGNYADTITVTVSY